MTVLAEDSLKVRLAFPMELFWGLREPSVLFAFKVVTNPEALSRQTPLATEVESLP